MRKLLCLLKSCFIVFAAVVCVVTVFFWGLVTRGESYALFGLY